MAENQKQDVRPSYYTNKGNYEPFKLFARYGLTNYYHCTALAYLARPEKPNNDRIQDFRKAITFLRHYMNTPECGDVCYMDGVPSKAEFEALIDAWQLPKEVCMADFERLNDLFFPVLPEDVNSGITLIEAMIEAISAETKPVEIPPMTYTEQAPYLPESNKGDKTVTDDLNPITVYLENEFPTHGHIFVVKRLDPVTLLPVTVPVHPVFSIHILAAFDTYPKAEDYIKKLEKGYYCIDKIFIAH